MTLLSFLLGIMVGAVLTIIPAALFAVSIYRRK